MTRRDAVQRAIRFRYRYRRDCIAPDVGRSTSDEPEPKCGHRRPFRSPPAAGRARCRTPYGITRHAWAFGRAQLVLGDRAAERGIGN